VPQGNKLKRRGSSVKKQKAKVFQVGARQTHPSTRKGRGLEWACRSDRTVHRETGETKSGGTEKRGSSDDDF